MAGMSFDKMPQPPQAEQYIDWPETETTMVVSPNSPIVRAECKIWTDRLAAEQLGDDETAVDLCRMMLLGLSAALYESLAVQRFADGHMGIDAATAGEAYLDCVTTVAFSRMWRDLKPEGPTRKPFDKGTLVSDFFSGQRAYSGLHAADGPLWELLQIDRPEPDQPVWFEGESIYLKASSPAKPSHQVPFKYRQRYRRFMDVHAFTSITPRLKSEAWPLPPLTN